MPGRPGCTRPAPGEFKIEYVGRIPAGIEGPALAEYNQAAQAWLSQMGFPQNIGPAVVERSLDVGQLFNAMGEAERALWVREQNALFERMAAGAEKAQERLQRASEALARAPGAFTEALHANGALHDAGIVLWLANHGERLAVRG